MDIDTVEGNLTIGRSVVSIQYVQAGAFTGPASPHNSDKRSAVFHQIELMQGLLLTTGEVIRHIFDAIHDGRRTVCQQIAVQDITVKHRADFRSANT